MTQQLTKLVRTTTSRRERGATAVEYALMMAFIALVIVAAVTLLGQSLSTFFTGASQSI